MNNRTLILKSTTRNLHKQNTSEKHVPQLEKYQPHNSLEKIVKLDNLSFICCVDCHTMFNNSAYVCSRQ